MKLKSGYANSITGDLEEIQCFTDFKNTRNIINSRFNIKKEKSLFSVRCFIVKREIVEKIDLFNEKFERSQEIEFTL